MKRRSGNNPKRRIVSVDRLSPETLRQLAERVRYVGSGHHKRYPADYGFERTNPVPTKSLCDALEPVRLAQAQAWLSAGVMHGMISDPVDDGFPKYIWCVAEDGRVFEAKTHPNTLGQYHGYPLENEDDMRISVKRIWDERCQEAGK